MKRVLKIIGYILLIIICIYFVFITEESIRLYNKAEAKPLIIFDRTKYCVECIRVGEEIEVEYYSLGFSVKTRYYKTEKSHDDINFIGINGKEFWLFNNL